jgi:ATP synthase, Delta/Epsilon chain, beta-sandwich domain
MSDADNKPAGVDAQEVIGEEAAVPETQAEKDRQQAVEEFSRMEKNGQLSMRVKVHSPFRTYYDGQAFSISAENATGPFDVLPRHHNFISLLTACEMIVRTVNKGDQTIRISGGIMHVKADRVVVFLDV